MLLGYHTRHTKTNDPMRNFQLLMALALVINILVGCDSMAETGECGEGGESGESGSGEHGESGSGEPGESGTQYSLTETAKDVRNGVELVIKYDSSSKEFVGTVTNTTNATVSMVRVEIHLSNCVELGPTPNVDLAPGEAKTVTLDARSQSNFDYYSVHVEIGSSSA